MKHLLVFSTILALVVAKEFKSHMTEMCKPQVSRQDLFDIAVTAGAKVLIRQLEGLNEELPIPSSLIVQITTMFAKYLLSGKSIEFILRLLYVACRLNKPLAIEAKSQKPVRTAYLCLWEMGKEKCYSYKGKEEGDFSVETGGM
ncbi:uncharacterized protein LOC108108907 [Drosophila eugracilis]|uniref:uncharacterized protein LOC108108907 n=1 Tax=Drosophila eugracilis TaxID=29029 RepID=UPI0007E83029|nr:uncharacterized protein LOC108108907 [Drosophila eugracilis]